MRISAGSMLRETSERLLTLINEARNSFNAIDAAAWNDKPSADKWSRKEILGHLVDSAANNQIRFIKAQLANNIFTGAIYEQDHFVSAQRYADVDKEDLIELWYAYNRHLAHVISHIDTSKLDIECRIGNNAPVSFSFLITDYVDHLQHHLSQLTGRNKASDFDTVNVLC